MWPPLIVVDAPGFDLGARIFDRRELVPVEAFVPQTAVEGFDEGIFDGFCRGE